MFGAFKCDFKRKFFKTLRRKTIDVFWIYDRHLTQYISAWYGTMKRHFPIMCFKRPFSIFTFWCNSLEGVFFHLGSHSCSLNRYVYFNNGSKNENPDEKIWMLGVVLKGFIWSGSITVLGTTTQAVIKVNPECLQLSEQLASRVRSETGCGSDPVMQPCSGIVKFHSQPSLRTPSYLGLLCQTYWKFCRVPELAEFLHLGLWESGQRDAVWVSQTQMCHSFST